MRVGAIERAHVRAVRNRPVKARVTTHLEEVVVLCAEVLLQVVNVGAGIAASNELGVEEDLRDGAKHHDKVRDISFL
ncbi:unannotated protein [freshwater metagenome]|uniref:Unannotated protein n=1 Tax=freshwater metagenome TaxID=449393 RepID=A0A6J6VM96_9ZZZZ